MPSPSKIDLRLLVIGLVPSVLPFVFFPFTIDAVLSPAFLAIVLAVFIGFAFVAFRRANTDEPVFISRYYLLLWLAWLALNIASLLYSSNVSDNYFEIARIVVWISLLLGCSFAIRQVPGAITAFARGVVIACIAEGAIGLYQIAPNILLLLRNADYGYYVIGTMAHKNLFSSGLMLMLPFVIYTMARDKGIWRIGAFIALVVAILDIAVLQTRAVWVGLVLATLVTAIVTSIVMCRNRTRVWQLDHKYKIAIAAFFAIGFVLLVIFQPLAFKRQYERVKSSINYNGPKTQANETIRERFMLWRNTIAMWKDAPMLGQGTSSWEVNMPKYGLENTRMEQGYTFFQRPHNDFLWVLSENGLVGFCIYLLIFLVPIYWLIKSAFKSNEDLVPALCMLFGIVAWMGDALFCFPSERNTHVFLLVSMFAIAMSKSSNDIDISRFRRTIAVVVLILLLPVSAVTYLRIAGEYHTRKLYYARTSQDYPAMISEGEKARSMVYQIDPVSAPLVWYEGTAYYAMKNYPEALRCFLESYKISPYHLPTLNNLGSCYESVGDKPKALESYKKALVLAPKFEETLLNISAMYFNMHQLDSAYLAISKIDTASTNPDYDIKLAAILRVEIQTLVLSNQLTEAQTQKVLEWKNDLPMMKNLLRGAMYNRISYTEEVKNRVTYMVPE